jgi:hypothetical protein
MKYLLRVYIVAALVGIPAFAQTPVKIEVGAYGGVPLNSTLQQNFCCTTGTAFAHYETEDASYITGLSAGVLVFDRIHVAFGATYMPVSFRAVDTICCPLATRTTPIHGTSWEFPMLGDYRWLSGAVRSVFRWRARGPQPNLRRRKSTACSGCHRRFGVLKEFVRHPSGAPLHTLP